MTECPELASRQAANYRGYSSPRIVQAMHASLVLQNYFRSQFPIPRFPLWSGWGLVTASWSVPSSESGNRLIKSAAWGKCANFKTRCFFPLPRPNDPIEYVAAYLLKHKDRYQQWTNCPCHTHIHTRFTINFPAHALLLMISNLAKLQWNVPRLDRADSKDVHSAHDLSVLFQRVLASLVQVQWGICNDKGNQEKNTTRSWEKCQRTGWL